MPIPTDREDIVRKTRKVCDGYEAGIMTPKEFSLELMLLADDHLAWENERQRL